MSQEPHSGQDPNRSDIPPDLYGPEDQFGQTYRPWQQGPGAPAQPWQQAQPYQQQPGAQGQPWQQPSPYQPGRPDMAPPPWQQNQQFQHYQQVQPYPVTIQPRNPGLALVASIFIPGLGSMLNNDITKGVVILVGYLVCAALSWLIFPVLGMIGLWIWGLVDAYQGAVAWNLRHGIRS